MPQPPARGSPEFGKDSPNFGVDARWHRCLSLTKVVLAHPWLNSTPLAFSYHTCRHQLPVGLVERPLEVVRNGVRLLRLGRMRVIEVEHRRLAVASFHETHHVTSVLRVLRVGRIPTHRGGDALHHDGCLEMR